MSNPNIPTPHITAKEGDFARTVLMPGDPHRSKIISDLFRDAEFTAHRGTYATYTTTVYGD